MRTDTLSECWRTALADAMESPSFNELQKFVASERQEHEVYPADEDVLAALAATPLSSVRVLILGQDPYHGEGQAHGLSFSVQPGVRIPPSLRNIYKELEADLSIEPAQHGCLTAWAKQGVLLLNTVLTVRAGEANSHRKRGWEELTDQIIDTVNEQPNVAFVLWGKPSQKKSERVDASRHLIIESPHPSPLSARRGFFGSKPFSKINAFLQQHGEEPIEWRLPTADMIDA
ncbi:MAG: uracil-DNA glycosylase [Planctomycetaceae bacterium]